MNIFGVVKVVGGLAAGVGATAIAGGVVNGVVTLMTVTNPVMKICVKLGGACLAAAAATAAVGSFESSIEGIERITKGVKERLKEEKMETVKVEA